MGHLDVGHNRSPPLCRKTERAKTKSTVLISSKGTSNNYQFVTPAPYQVRGKLRRESSDVKSFWIPAFAGMTFLEVALRETNFLFFNCGLLYPMNS